MRCKFKIHYPQDHHDPELAGKEYKPAKGVMVVMNRSGVFFLVDLSDFYAYCRKLSDVLPKYDVKWKGDS